MDWTLLVAAGSLEIVILSSAVGIVWKLTRTEVSLRGEFNKEISMIRADAAKEIAEMQTKVYKVEIWSRDEFVGKGSFEAVVARLEKTLEIMGTKIETAVDKMATKVDNLQQQQQQQHHRDA